MTKMQEKGRPASKYSQAYRLIKIIELMQSRGQVTVETIALTFGTSRRTAHRDLAVLQESYAVTEGGRLPEGDKLWSLVGPKRGDLLKLSVMELTSLYMGKNLFTFLDGTALKGAIDSVFAKVSHRLASNRPSYRMPLDCKFYCTPGVVKDYAAIDDLLNALITGLLEEQKVEVRYRKPNSAPHTDILHPYTLVVHNNTLYLIAYCERHDAIRTYALDRLLSAEWLRGQAFRYPQEYRPQDYLDHAFGITVGAPALLRLKVKPEVVEYFRLRRWHHSQHLDESDPAQAYVSLFVPQSAELLSWLLSFGDKIEVLEPMALREKLRGTSLGIYTLYEAVGGEA